MSQHDNCDDTCQAKTIEKALKNLSPEDEIAMREYMEFRKARAKKKHVSNCHRAETYSTKEYNYVCSKCNQPCIGNNP